MSNSPLAVVILAAGNGLRLSTASPLPKPLVTVDGRPLLDRVLGAVALAGLAQVHVVVGHAADSIRSHRFPSADTLDIEWIENPEYNRANGVSLLRAQGHVEPPFVLLMADHLFEVDTLRRFLRQPAARAEVLMAVDRKVHAVYDLPDAMKVSTTRSSVRSLGKDLREYDAIDTGMFICGDAIFDAMRESAAAGRDALADGMSVMSQAGLTKTWDIGAARWIDVDTPAARDEAERLVREGCFSLSPKPLRAPLLGGGWPRRLLSSARRRSALAPMLGQPATCAVVAPDDEPE